MATLNARQQTKLSRQLQSNDLDEVQAGLTCLLQTDPTKLNNEERFRRQLPVLAAALPLVVPSLLKHALAERAPRDRRLECLQGIVGLLSYVPESVAGALNPEQVLSYVCVLGQICTWPSADRAPDAMWTIMLATYMESSATLLETGPINMAASDAFYTQLLPHAPDTPHTHDAALRVALPVLLEVVKTLETRDHAAVSKAANTMMMVASWDLSLHIASLIDSPAPRTPAAVPGLARIPSSDRTTSLIGVAYVLKLLQYVNFQTVIIPSLVPEHQLARLLASQHELRRRTRSCSGWPGMQPYLHLQMQSSCATAGDQASYLLLLSWIPMDMWRLDTCALGAATAGSSNAEVLVRALAGQLAQSEQDKRREPSLVHTFRPKHSPEDIVLLWWHILGIAQLGMQHPIATEEGMSALLKAGMLRGLKQGLVSCTTKPTLHPRQLVVACFAALVAWYAERFPAVPAGMAAEHLVACRLEARLEQAGSGAGSSSTGSGTPSAASSSSSCSLWSLLLLVLACEGGGGVEQGVAQGSKQHVRSDRGVEGQGAALSTASPADSAAGPTDYIGLSADEFAALPAAQLRRRLDVPPLAVSMGKLQQLVGQQMQMLQSLKAAPRRSTLPPSALSPSSTPSPSLSTPVVQQPEALQGAGPGQPAAVQQHMQQEEAKSSSSTATGVTAAAVAFVTTGAGVTATAVAAGTGTSCSSSSSSAGAHQAVPCTKPTEPSAAAASAAAMAAGSAHHAVNREPAGQTAQGAIPNPASLLQAAGAGRSAAAAGNSRGHVDLAPAGPEMVAAGSSGGSVAAGSDAPACVVCGAAHRKEGGKLQLCAGCASVRYCSSTCQKQHWKHGGHRQACKELQAAAAAVVAAAAAAGPLCGNTTQQ